MNGQGLRVFRIRVLAGFNGQGERIFRIKVAAGGACWSVRSRWDDGGAVPAPLPLVSPTKPSYLAPLHRSLR